MSNLVIVESPAKAKTIKKYLGSGFDVLASNGHIRDLPKSKIGVDIENGFEPVYVETPGKEDLVQRLKETALNSDKVFLATDPDREGEAISWHLAQMLGLDVADQNRVTFNEITKTGVRAGMEHPRSIDLDLVNAQQARRILDRIVGYKLSPFLWKKVKRGLSAGRVQSVAVRIVVDREEEIRRFQSEEYWTIDALLKSPRSEKTFEAKLYGTADGKKLSVGNGEDAAAIISALDGADYVVTSLKRGTRKKNPAPPFITSTLQQEASRKLNFVARRTMKAAQELYEGVDIPGLGATGLITYMRTDSLRISDEARAEGVAYITSAYGKEYLPEKPRVYKSRAGAQDAHEAIRPTMPSLTPDKVKDSLTLDQYRLYRLIWERFIASLMQSAVYSTVSADITANNYLFKASGFHVKFDGFTVLYVEGRDEAEESASSLPPLEEKDVLALEALTPNQHFTQPPARYTEATLIKALEENGIGRPSTYAPTITTILQREYIEREQKSLKPTPLGEVITKLMEEYFTDIMDVEFTANMEKQLDHVEEGKEAWRDLLSHFYGGFEKTLQNAEEKMDGTRVKIPDVETDVKCELCGRNMVIKSGRFGKFLACPGYPECKFTKAIVQETPGECPRCGGKILLKKSKNGHKYYGCENFPTCTFMTWDEPKADRCPSCGSTLFKARGGSLNCLNEGCEYHVEPKPRASKKKAEEGEEKASSKTKTAKGAKTKNAGAKKTPSKTTKKASSTKTTKKTASKTKKAAETPAEES